VDEDRVVDVGSWLTRWNPLSHTGYWGDAGVADVIAAGVTGAWRQSSAIALVAAKKPSARPRRTASQT